ncbi:YcxB family protein [Candidatus Lokiarchaeum ossiferum]
MKSNKNFGSANVVEFFNDGRIEARSENAKSEFRIDSFIHYKVSKGWIYLFIQKNLFIPIRISDATPNESFEELLGLLHKFGIKKKG